MNTLVPAIIMIILAVFIIREIKLHSSIKGARKEDAHKLHLAIIERLKERLGWVLSKQPHKDNRHVWLVAQTTADFSPATLEVFEQQLISALKSYPGEADELLLSNKDVALKNKETKKQRREQYRGHPGKSSTQKASAIPNERWS